MDFLPQMNPGRPARRAAVAARMAWLAPAGVAAGVGALMVWGAGVVHVPNAVGRGAADAEPALPSLRITRLDALPPGGEAQEPPRSTYWLTMNLPLYSPTAPAAGRKPG